MHPVLLGAAAIAALSIPAASAAALDPQTLTAASVTVHRGGGLPTGHPGYVRWDGSPTGKVGFSRDGRRGEGWRGHRRGFGGAFVGRWADHQDRTFEHDSYNDWWHERPHRAFPRWVRENAQTCDRRWWSGGVWRC